MERLTGYRKAFQRLPDGCTGAEVSAVFTQRTTVSGQDGQFVGYGANERNALLLRVNAGGTGSVYTEDLSDDPAQLLKKAADNAQSIPNGKPHPIAPKRVEAVCPENATLKQPQELRTLAEELSRQENIQRCTVSQEQRKVCVLNTNGLEVSRTSTVCGIELSVCGKGEDNFKTYYFSRSRFEDFDTAAILKRIQQEKALDYGDLPYIKLQSGKYRAVISNAVVINIMNTAWQLFAQRLINNGKSCFATGQRVGSDAFSVTDAAVLPDGGYDFSLDAEGICGPERNVLVKDGVMCSTLRTLSDGESTGNAGRDDLLSGVIHTEVISIPRNIFIEAGDKPVEELLSEMETGIHLTYSVDQYHSTNITAGSFNIPCGGVYYENGKPIGRVQQMNMYGSFTGLFGAITGVGNDMQMKPMATYRSYCFGGPSLLVDGVQFTM